jgi:hypothetical protein
MNNVVLISFVIVITIFCGCKDDEDKLPKSTLQGVVKDEFGGTLDSVSCVVVSSSGEYRRLTNEHGAFNVEGITIGTYSVTISKKNYITSTEEIEVKPDPTKIELILSSGNSFLRLSDSVLTVSYTAASKTILIESNTLWTVINDCPWLKTSTVSEAGRANLHVSWEKSVEDAERVGYITIKAGSIQKKVSVRQAAPLKLLHSQGIIGNMENEIGDSIKLAFNKPISVKTITTSYEACLSEIKHKVSGTRLSFAYACARLGNSYPFSVSVMSDNETFTFQLEVKFYDMKTTITGYMDDYIVTDDNKVIWGITRFPNKLVKISLPDLTVLKELDLEVEPTAVRWNSFKNTVNVFSHHSTCSYQQIVNGECKYNYLMHVDPETLEISKSEIKLIKGFDADNPGYPAVFPKDIVLFKDGTGVIQLANEYNYWGWRFIDSKNSDSTFISDIFFTSDHDLRFQELHVNYDKTKIYMMHPWGSTSIDVYELGSSKLQTYTSPLSGRSGILIANKKNNRLFHGQLYEQFISDMQGYMSKVSYIDTRAFYGGIDFGYRKDEDETIYYLADGLFQILDYKTAFTSFSTETVGTLSKIRSTTDGINLVAIKKNSEATTDIFVFNIENMTKNEISKSPIGGRGATGGRHDRISSWESK